MTSPLGQYGAKGYESSESRTLGQFASDKFTYRDQARNIIQLNNAVGYMSGYMRKMQRGIDEANQNFIQQLQGLLNDFIVLLGGGGDTGLEFGDLKYVLQAIGALFGFGTEEGGIGLPINLFNAAWYFISSYILPVQNFTDAINFIVDGLIASVLDIFGEVPILGQALQQLAVIISDIRDLLTPVAEALETFLDVFNLDLGDLPGITNVFSALAPIWEALKNALDGINLPDFSAMFHEIAQWTTPFVQLIAEVINMIYPILTTLIDTGAGVLVILADLLVPIIEILAPIIDLIAPVINALFPILQAVIDIVNQFVGLVGGVANLGDMFNYLLTAISPLNALNLFNNIPQDLIGLIPFNHIGEGNPNLLANPSFDGAVSVQGGIMWLWDAVIGHTTPGSVYTIANGTLKQLRSNAIPVSKDQELNLTAYSMWAGLAFTGTPFKLQVVRLLNHEEIGIDDLASPASPGANQATWIQIGNDYTVPSGCDEICFQLVVNSTATAGTIRFDDGDVHKTGSAATFVPFWNVTGIGGPDNIGDTIQDTWDKLISGFVNTPGGTGAVLPDVFGIGNIISSWASLGNFSFNILGIRNNKSIHHGFLPTSESNVSMSSVALQPTAPTFGITATTAITAYQRISEAVDKGVVSWQGYGVTNVTDCRINIYKMDQTTGVNTQVHASTNQVGLLSGGSVPQPVVYTLPAYIHFEPGEVVGIEIVVRGTGTHNIVGQATWLQDQAVYPRRFSSVRDSSSVLAPASFTPTYGSNVPFIEFGISAGSVSVPHIDTPNQINAVGATTLPIPIWANYVDVIALGGGGAGGAGSLYGIPGNDGGAAGSWATATWTRGTDFTGSPTININVGDGGIPRADAFGPPAYGGSTVVSITGHTVTAVGGGDRLSGTQKGQGAGNQIYRGVTYPGGGAQNNEPGDGIVPGGGGGSGSNYSGSSGGDGAKGRAWIVFRQS